MAQNIFISTVLVSESLVLQNPFVNFIVIYKILLLFILKIYRKRNYLRGEKFGLT